MIELLCLITNEKNDKKVKNIEEKYQLPFNITSFGNGTASSSVLNYFGLEKIKKYIYFSLINNENKKTILKEIKKELKLNTPGNGIAFTIPLSSSTNYIKTKLNSMEVPMKEENKKEIKKENKKEYHLIVTVITEGYSENVMNAAKKQGANGGTLINGRSLSHQNNTKAKFLGFSIEPEKDIVLIVTESDLKNKIMEAITKIAGLKTKGGGIVFSLPISEAIGLIE